MLIYLLAGCATLLLFSSYHLQEHGSFRWFPASLGGLLLLQMGVLITQQPQAPTAAPQQFSSEVAVTPLHKPLYQDWQAASPETQQATAIQWLKEMRLLGQSQLRIRSETEYKVWAAALVKCIEDNPQTWSPDTELAPQISTHCLPQLKYYRHGGGKKHP